MMRTRRPTAAGAMTLASALVLSACSLDDLRDLADGGGGRGDRIEVADVTFEAPEGWEEIDPDDLAAGTDAAEKYAEDLGQTPEQLAQAVRASELFLYSDDGAQDGFTDNINVVEAPGSVPSESQLKNEVKATNGKVEDTRKIETDAGEATIVDYRLRLGAVQLVGRSLLVEVDGNTVAITVTATDEATRDDVGELIAESLDEA